MFDGEFFQAMARDTRADRLHEAVTDDLARLATKRPAGKAEWTAFARAVVGTLKRRSVVRRLRPSVGRAIG